MADGKNVLRFGTCITFRSIASNLDRVVQSRQASFSIASRQQKLLLIRLRLKAIDLGQRCLLLFVKRNEQTDYHQPEREE